MKLSQFLISLQSIALKPIERYFRKSLTYNHNVKPVWIIGVPRSGTTLAYQLFCTAFKTSYLSNRVVKRYRIALLTRMAERFLYSKKLIPPSFESAYGYTQSANGPHEGGPLFYQYFPKEYPYTDADDLDEKDAKEFKRVIQAISYPNKLFVSKNTVHSLRIKALAKLFPDSVFLWVTRDKVATAHSIINARDANGIRSEQWWSVKPPGWIEKNKLPEIEKVVWQINEIESIIRRDLAEARVSFMKISYKDICENPRKLVEEVAHQFHLNDYVQKIGELIPPSFPYSKAPEDELAEELKKIWND
ncbi:MAG: sulfotransferase [Gracilimonas sp.]|uniref:sulfotransferase n=1 Tax=Gracilimonas TaxID=649462 RepID=UPI001B0B3FC1|nr:sulfotransferase [Gracilimonas sp.]MBO6584540.1 sulfotransferase [Gracilimonas sp.]MBO6616189.1 sulfotransferase [Gracilimonas sp.]